MSRVRGVFPLFLATAFGVVNGVYVFGPSFNEQGEQRDGKPLEIANEVNDEEINKIRKAEVDASRIASTESALSNKRSSSWWPSMSLWATESSAKGNANIITAAATSTSTNTTPEEAHKQEEEEK